MISNTNSLKRIIEISRPLGIRNIFDIGSRDGDDANFIASSLGVNDVYVFEPIPESAQYIATKYPKFIVQQLAISDNDGEVIFNAIKSNNVEDRGISSIRDRPDGVYEGRVNRITVKTNRFDTWCAKNQITNVDLVKLDVEGCTFEALVGFGKQLSQVKAIHLETESRPYWSGQKLKSDVEALLSDRFILKHEMSCGGYQFDQVWVNRNS
jgi:FkbM family methyltransferase